MSVKHIKAYYNDVRKQKEEMDWLLQMFSEKADKEAVDPQVLENLRIMSEPVTASYDTLKYIMYLLNLPNNQKKMYKHEKNTKKERASLKQSCSPESVKAENEVTIKSIKQQIGD